MVEITDGAGLMALGLIVVLLVFVFLLAIYVYTSFAYMAIARKAKDKMPGLAWIPSVGPALIAFRSAGMHWWPWLLLIGIVIPYVGFLALIAFAVFNVVWHWKLFEKLGRPGWWAILTCIPIVNLVMIGIAAWGKK